MSSIASVNAQALQAISVSQAVSANNVANMNTSGFHSSRVEYETGPEGQGVRVQEIRENTQEGPLVSEYSDGEYRMVEGSNTDLTTEMVQQMVNEQAFAANVASMRTEYDMTGVLLDMVV